MLITRAATHGVVRYGASDPSAYTLSVVLASRNRAQVLERALRALTAMRDIDGHPWEVVVIDNGSTDDTAALVQRFATTTPMPVIRYLFEGRRGKSRALNAGIAAARGDILAFLDDDCVAPPNWIGAILREFAADPELAMLGGRVELLEPDDVPMTIKLFTERRHPVLSDFTFGVILGANMALRRSVFDHVGGFDTDLGPGGLGGGDDDDLLYRVLRMRLKVTCTPDVLVYHGHGRKDAEAAMSLQRAYDRGHGGFYAKHLLRGDGYVLKRSYWEVHRIVGAVISSTSRGRWPSTELRRLASMTIGASVKLRSVISDRVAAVTGRCRP